ncbi:hypothetical protein, partial [Actinomyces israelii]|uniref:hypothetical protein n=1 Tax=Actinomyces israelii TaxID=1659 RepID=UPI00235572D5
AEPDLGPAERGSGPAVADPAAAFRAVVPAVPLFDAPLFPALSALSAVLSPEAAVLSAAGSAAPSLGLMRSSSSARNEAGGSTGSRDAPSRARASSDMASASSSHLLPAALG